MDTIEFTAAVQKVQTLVDGGIRVTLDLSEQDVLIAAQLMECKRQGACLVVSAVPGIKETADDSRFG